MQIVTPLSSPIFLTRFSPAMVFCAPSSSDMPARLPENVMTLGTPALAASGMFVRNACSIAAWFSTRFRGLANFAAARISHGAYQAVAARDFVLLRLQQIHSSESDLRGVFRQLINGDVRVAPLADGLVNSPFASRAAKQH